MSLRAEIIALRRDLQRLSLKAEVKLVRRYGRLPLEQVSLDLRVRKAVVQILRRLRLKPPGPPPEPWRPDLRHLGDTGEPRPLLIWALGTRDREMLRAACRGFEKLHTALPEFAPVLVTDVADFAFYSRLGWLVEYIPALSAPADRYAERKRRYLAWRYRDAPALPIAAGLDESVRPEDLLLD